jgi:hypothetical protein
MEGRNWIGDSLVRKLGNGNSTSFWKSRWIGDSSFSVMFPRLFSLSNHKESLVSEVGVNNGIRWCWHLSWRRPLFQWEADLGAQLLSLLESVVLAPEDDAWSWAPNPEGVFLESVVMTLE